MTRPARDENRCELEWRARTCKDTTTDIPGLPPPNRQTSCRCTRGNIRNMCGHAQPPLPAILTGSARSSRIVPLHLTGGGCIVSVLLGAGTGSPSCMLIAWTGI